MTSRFRLAFALGCLALWAIGAFAGRWIGIWAGLGGAAVVLGVAVLATDLRATLELLRPSVARLGMGVAAGAAMVALTELLYPLIARAAPFVVNDVGRLYAAFRETPPVVAGLALGPVILGEELAWRGAVQGALQRRLAAWLATGITALACGLGHAPFGSPVLVVAALGCGLLWGALRAATRSLVPSLISHLIWDIMVLGVMPLQGG